MSRLTADEALARVIRGKEIPLRDWERDMGPRLNDAERRLAEAVGSARVKAFGRENFALPKKQIPAECFNEDGAVIGFDGRLKLPRAPYNYPPGHGWSHVELDAADMRREFPAPDRVERAASAREWMEAEARKHIEKHGGPAKRDDDLIPRCMKECSVTRREAEAAHRALPSELKAARGRPAG